MSHDDDDDGDDGADYGGELEDGPRSGSGCDGEGRIGDRRGNRNLRQGETSVPARYQFLAAAHNMVPGL